MGEKKVLFQPKPDERKTVEALAAFGMPRDRIAAMIGISEPTLRKHFRDELDNGLDKANAAVAKTLFSMATSGECPAATFFWLKTRAKWREVHTLEHTNPDGTMTPTVIKLVAEEP